MVVRKIDVGEELKVEVSDINELIIKCSKKQRMVKVVAPESLCVRYNEKKNILKIGEGGDVVISCSGGKKPGIVAGGNVTIVGCSGVQVGIGSDIVQNQGISGTSFVMISVPSGTKVTVDEDVKVTREFDSKDNIIVEIDN